MRVLYILSLLGLTFFLINCSGAPQVTSSSKPGSFIDKKGKLAVVPSKIGSENDILLPDAIETELLKNGFNIIDRTSVKQMIKEKGLDYTEILNGEEYFKLGQIIDVQYIALVNSKWGEVGISSATMKIIEMDDSQIVFSATYSQPIANNSTYINFDNINDTSMRMVQSILPIARN